LANINSFLTRTSANNWAFLASHTCTLYALSHLFQL